VSVGWTPVSSIDPSIDIRSNQPAGYGSCTPVPLVADRVSLPARAGTASLLDLLPPDLRASYAEPASLFRPPDAPPVHAGAVPIRDREQYERLIVRMRAAGMVTFTTSPKVVNGVFTVPKDVDKQRLIIDARRANALFVDAPHTDLPTPDLLSRLTVDAATATPLYVGGDDVDNFYHRLRLPGYLTSPCQRCVRVQWVWMVMRWCIRVASPYQWASHTPSSSPSVYTSISYIRARPYVQSTPSHDTPTSASTDFGIRSTLTTSHCSGSIP